MRSKRAFNEEQKAVNQQQRAWNTNAEAWFNRLEGDMGARSRENMPGLAPSRMLSESLLT
jgi:hypothetical protein